MTTKYFSLFAWTLVLALSTWSFEPNPDLPNVLVMGDSNTTGYFLKLRELLKEKANVFYPLRPNGSIITTVGVRSGPWKLILPHTFYAVTM